MPTETHTHFSQEWNTGSLRHGNWNRHIGSLGHDTDNLNIYIHTSQSGMRMPIQNMSTTPAGQHLHRGWEYPYRTCQQHQQVNIYTEDVNAHTERVNTSKSTFTQRMRMPIQNMSAIPASQHLHRGWGYPYRTCQQHQQVNTYTEDMDAHTVHVNNTSKSTLSQRIIMPIQNMSTTPASQHLHRG